MVESVIGTHLGPYQPLVDAALRKMAEDSVFERVWAHDYTVWKPAPSEITNRLGWLDVANRMRSEVNQLQAFAESVRATGCSDVLLLGMGGSSLAPELFGQVFHRRGYPRLTVLDTTDPLAVLTCSQRLAPEQTLVVVSTKSGTTVETLSLCKFFYNWAAQAMGPQEAGRHFVAITDPGSHLENLAKRLGFLAVFLADPNIGGRYSALSHFGLVPAALVGADLTRLLDSALAAAAQCAVTVATRDNPGALLGAVLGELARSGRDKATFVVSPAIKGFGDWVEQLIAESTGKEGRGILPVVDEEIGPTAVYGNDRLFVHLGLQGSGSDQTLQDALDDLVQSGHPLVRLRLGKRYGLGGQFFLWEMATAVAGHLLGINPFDQPDVEAAKALARSLVAEHSQKGAWLDELPCVSVHGIQVFGAPSARTPEEALRLFLQPVQNGDYVALQAYLTRTTQTNCALQALRIKIRNFTRLATTLGYGPRFLHSTGQLHKGDAGRGLFIQLTADDPHDVPIPDEAGVSSSTITFGVLKAAQAAGDRQALVNAGRRVIRFHFSGGVVRGLRRLTDALH